jgi:hypothetical protein
VALRAGLNSSAKPRQGFNKRASNLKQRESK